MPLTLHVRCADASAKLPEAVAVIDGNGKTVITAEDFSPQAWTNVLTATKAEPCDVENAAQYHAIVG